jgi:opacity protein-like surface antigen
MIKHLSLLTAFTATVITSDAFSALPQNNRDQEEIALSDDDHEDDDEYEDEYEDDDEESTQQQKTSVAKKRKRTKYFTGFYVGPDVSYGTLLTRDNIKYNVQTTNSSLNYNSAIFQCDIGGRVGAGLDLFHAIYIGIDFSAHFVNNTIKRTGSTTIANETYNYEISLKEKWKYMPSVQFGFHLNNKTIIYGIGGYEWASFDLNSTYILSQKVHHKDILSGFVGGGGIGVALGRHFQIRFETTKSFLDTLSTSKSQGSSEYINYKIRPRELASNLSFLYRF